MIGSKVCATQLRANWEPIIGIAAALAVSNTGRNCFFSYVQDVAKGVILLLCQKKK